MSLVHGLDSNGKVVPLTVSATGTLAITDDVGEKAAASGTAVMTTGDTIFTIAGGPIIIVDLLSECITANGVGATTMQYQSNPTVGTATAISAASASLASATAGTTVRLNPTTLATAPTVVAASAGGVQLGANVANLITIQPGTLKLVLVTGPTTGTWKHYIRYQPLSTGVTVV